MEPELSRLCLLGLLMTSSVPLMQFLFDLILAPASRELARSWYLKLSPARISSAAEPTYFQRFPAILGIATRWGVVQSVGHLTVNEDGGGSNPPAPASFSREKQQSKWLALSRGQSRGYPAFPAAVHGFHADVPHLLKIVRG